MKKISVIIAGRHSTSISLEDEFWQEFQQIAKEKKLTINQLVTQIDSIRQKENLSSAIRIYILNELKQKNRTD